MVRSHPAPPFPLIVDDSGAHPWSGISIAGAITAPAPSAASATMHSVGQYLIEHLQQGDRIPSPATPTHTLLSALLTAAPAPLQHHRHSSSAPSAASSSNQTPTPPPCS